MTYSWPSLQADSTIPGTIRSTPEDFIVEEIPAYLPSGTGSHLMLYFQKRNLTTQEVLALFASHFNISANDIGVAGMKDKSAITRQWCSVPALCQNKVAAFSHEEIQILETKLHGNKLRTGHLKGNLFRIVARNIPMEKKDELENRCQILAANGFPNYFGPQRFGRQATNVQQGIELLKGKGRRLDRRLLRLLLSATQSALFNDVLAQRIRLGLFSKALEGDLMQKTDSGGIFWCQSPETDQPRMDSFEISPTGPIFGTKMKTPRGEVANIEEEVFKKSGLTFDCWKRFPKLTQGTRRPLRALPRNLKFQIDQDECLMLSFELPAGSYATSLLGELIRFSENI